MWNPDAVRVVNTAGDTPFHLAIRFEENNAIDLLQWSLTFDEVVDAYAACNKSCDRLRPVLEIHVIAAGCGRYSVQVSRVRLCQTTTAQEAQTGQISHHTLDFYARPTHLECFWFFFL